MRYQTKHKTEYLYAAPVSQCVSEAHLIPRAFSGQTVIEAQVTVEPPALSMSEREDYFGNRVSVFSILERHDRLTVTCTGVVDVFPAEPRCWPELSWEAARTELRHYKDDASLTAYEFVFDSPFVAASTALREYGAASLFPGAPLVQAVVDLSSRVHKDFVYTPKSTSVEMPLEEVFQRRRGVCQDFSHVMIGVLRSHGLAARYVSGYLQSGAHYTGAEASHAWVSVYIPGHGWLDLDPTNDMMPGEGHVTVAWGRDYGDVTPVKGVSLGGGEQTVNVEVRVVPEGTA
jgi:transglutaminase-like putative cysteine protease